MPEKNPDDIMAEHLLRGGKMLSRSCRACGSPLFEVKGETLCVVCREKGGESAPGKEADRGAASPTVPAGAGTAGVAGGSGTGAATGGSPPAGGHETDEERELRLAIAVLARRAREETDPDRCRALMEAARNGALAFSFLQR